MWFSSSIAMNQLSEPTSIGSVGPVSLIRKSSFFPTDSTDIAVSESGIGNLPTLSINSIFSLARADAMNIVIRRNRMGYFIRVDYSDSELCEIIFRSGMWFSRSISLSRTSSSATPNRQTNSSSDLLKIVGPRNPESEAARGWLQRLVGPYLIETDVFNEVICICKVHGTREYPDACF